MSDVGGHESHAAPVAPVKPEAGGHAQPDVGHAKTDAGGHDHNGAEQALAEQLAHARQEADAAKKQLSRRESQRNIDTNGGQSDIVDLNIDEEDAFPYAERPPQLRLTNHAVDKAVAGLMKDYLPSGEVRKGWGRGVLPLVTALGTEASLNPGSSGVLRATYDVLTKSEAAKAVGAAAYDVGNTIGKGVDAMNYAQHLFSAAGTGAIAAGILTPTISLAKRIFMKENSWKYAAKYMMRRDEDGFFKKMIRGAESWAMKKAVLHKSKGVKQLLQWADQGVDFSKKDFGRKQLLNIIADGTMAGTTVGMLSALEVPMSSKDKQRIDELNRAFNTAKTLFDAKYPSKGQKEIVSRDILPKYVRNKERALWLRETALMTGVSMAKSASMVGLLEMFAPSNINKIAGLTKDIVSTGADWVSNTVPIVGQTAKDISAYIASKLDWVVAQTQAAGSQAPGVAANLIENVGKQAKHLVR